MTTIQPNAPYSPNTCARIFKQLKNNVETGFLSSCSTKVSITVQKHAALHRVTVYYSPIELYTEIGVVAFFSASHLHVIWGC